MISPCADVQPIRTDYALYKLQHTAKGNTITINRDFAMAEIGFKQSDYADLRKFFDGVSAGDSQPLILTAAK